MRYRDVSLGAY